MFFHVDSGKLASVLEHLKNGRTVEGKQLEKNMEFIMGSGVESVWGKNVPKQGMQEMETMREMGTGYFLTTPIFDLDQFQKFLKQVKTFDIPVIAEVMLLRNAAMARFINRHFKAGLIPDWVVQKLDKAPDKKKASIELFADTIKGCAISATAYTSLPWAESTRYSPIWTQPALDSVHPEMPIRPISLLCASISTQFSYFRTGNR